MNPDQAERIEPLFRTLRRAIEIGLIATGCIASGLALVLLAGGGL